jgi:hypothetical protein
VKAQRHEGQRGTIPQQIAHLDAKASTMREDLKETRVGLLAKPEDERLAKQVAALEGLLKGLTTKVERLRRKGQQA